MLSELEFICFNCICLSRTGLNDNYFRRAPSKNKRNWKYNIQPIAALLNISSFLKFTHIKVSILLFHTHQPLVQKKIILQNILAKVSFRTFRYEFVIFKITVSWNSDEGIGLCSVALGRCWTQRYVRSWANKEESRDQTRSEFLTHYSLGLLALNWLAGSVFAFKLRQYKYENTNMKVSCKSQVGSRWLWIKNCSKRTFFYCVG